MIGGYSGPESRAKGVGVLMRPSSPLFALAGLLLAACGGGDDLLGEPPRIVTTALPEGKVGEPYAAVVEVSGGVPSYSFPVAIDVPGLRIDDGGRIVGVPAEAGVFSVALEVADGNGLRGAANLRLTIREAGAAPVLESSCVEPVVVQRAGLLASVRARFPPTNAEASACGFGDETSQLFVALDMEAPGEVEVELFTAFPGSAALRRVGSSCDATEPASCAEGVLARVPAGRTIFLVEGRPDDEVTVLFRFTPPSSSPTCETPVPLDFDENGRVTIALDEYEDLPPRSGCNRGAQPTAVFALNLDAASDIVVEEAEQVFSIAMAARSDDCAVGEDRGCLDIEAGRRLVGVPAGSSYLLFFGEPRPGAEVKLALRPATPRPENDRCEAAAPLDVSSGAAEVEVSFLATEREQAASCGWHGLYYHLRLDAPARLDAWVEGGFDIDLELLAVDGATGCRNPTSLTECQDADFCAPLVPAGDYVLAARAREPRPTGTLRVELREAREPSPPGDTCGAAPTLAVAAPGRTRLEAAAFGATPTDPDLACFSQAVPEVWRAMTLPPGRWAVRFEGWSPAVSVTDGACDEVLVDDCASPVRSILEGGEYRLAVLTGRYDPLECRPAGTPDLSVDVVVDPAGPAPAGDRCAEAPTVTLATGTSTVVRVDVRDAANDQRRRRCPDDQTLRRDGRGEVFRRIELTTPARLLAQRLDQADVDVALFSACGAVDALACVGWGRLDTRTPLPAGAYWLVVSADHDETTTELLLSAIPPQ